MEQSFSALIRRPQTLEIRLRPVYPLENNELYALLYDPRGNILMQSVLPTDELSPYTFGPQQPGSLGGFLSFGSARRGWSGLHYTRLNAV